MDWQLQDAKNHFSKVVQCARTEGPQIVTIRGARTAVVLSIEEYDALRAEKPSLVDHLLDGPTWDDGLAETITQRAKTPSRDVEF